MEIVINKCYGGFGLSEEAFEYYKNISKNKKIAYSGQIKRNDIYLIETVKKFKEKANGAYADLKIVKIPNKVKWIIQEYDGTEWIAEKHRIWS